MESTPAVVDTVVLRYFLLVDQFELLLQVLGEPLRVSRVVYDPEDAGDERAMSEMVRSVHLQSQRSVDKGRREEERKRADRFATRLATVHGHVADGTISVIDMSESELELFSRLSSDDHVAEFGLTFPLDEGEAATLAIAIERGWVFVSDDSDALTAMQHIRRRHPYQRIRKILIAAADEGAVTRDEANAIHSEMRDFGFWDMTSPFEEG